MDLNIKKSNSNKRTKINNKKGFTYDDPSHTYTMDGVVLKSTTQHIKEWSKPFDANIVSSMVAKKNTREGNALTNPASVRKYWRLLGKRSSALGTTGHEYCEMWWMDRVNAIPITKLDENAKKLMEQIDKNFNIIRMETPKGSKKYAMGYTVDILLQNKITGKYYVGDFKFSKAFTSEQYKADKKRLPARMTGILKDFRDVGHDKGILQLNVYIEFLLEEGIKVDGGFLFHVDGLSSFYGEKGFKAYEIPLVPHLVKEILKDQIKHSITDVTLNSNTMDKL